VSRRNFPDESRDRGQASVEFALTIPVLLLVLLGAVQVFVLLVDRLHLVHVTRDATRAASVSGSPSDAVGRVVERAWPDRSVTYQVNENGDLVSIRVQLVNSTDVPIIGRFLPDVRLTESLTMLIESFDSG
jgi:Flp pilus assembly protein TadG